MQFQLWGYATGSDTPVILPTPLAFSAGLVLSDVSSMSLTYPIDAVGIDLLSSKHCDVELRYLDGTEWKCAVQGRFCLTDKDVNVVAETMQRTRTYTIQSWSWLLRDVLQEQTTGLDSNGGRPFADQSVGQIAATLITEAKAVGAVPDMTVANHVADGGNSPAYAVGKSVYDILADYVATGQCDWVVEPDVDGQGRELAIYSTLGSDLSTGADPVTIRHASYGGVVDAPSQISIKDLSPRVIVQGDGGKYKTYSNPAAFMPHGATSSFVTASGLTDDAALQIVGQAQLSKGSGPRAQHTRQIDFNGQWLPLLHYSLGDTILAPDEAGALTAMKVRQITITMQQQGGAAVYGGNLVLGDRFTERDLQLDKKVSRLTGGAASIGGTGTKPTTFADDPRKPSAPTGFNVGSTPYTDSDGAYRAVASFGWVNPTEATDGSDMDPGSVEVWGRKGTSGSFARITTAQFPDTSVQFSPFDAGVVWQFKARAISVNAKPGPYTAVVQVTMAKDTTPPGQPSVAALATRLGQIVITWDGLDIDGVTVPADYLHTEVHSSTAAGFTPGAATLVGYLLGPGRFVLADQPYGVMRYIRLVSVDRAGNNSTPSITASIAAQPMVDTDIIGKIIDGAHIQSGTITASDAIIGNTITGGLIQARTITGGNIAFNTLTGDNMVVGSIDGIYIKAGTLSADLVKVGADLVSLAPSLAAEPGSWTVDQGGTVVPISGAIDGTGVSFNNVGRAMGPMRMTQPGEQWYVQSQAWMQNDSGAANRTYLGVLWYAADRSYLSVSVVATHSGVAGVTMRLSGSATAPAGAMYARFLVERDGLGGGNATAWDMAGYRQADGTRIEDGVITTVKIAAGAVTANEIVVGGLPGSAIAAGAISNSKILDNAVNAVKIADGAVTASKVAAGAITAGKIDANAINGMVITGATVQTSTANPRIQLTSSNFYLTDAGGGSLINFSSTGAFVIQSSTTVASSGGVRLDNTSGLRAWNTSGTRLVSIAPDGSAELLNAKITGTLQSGSVIAGSITATNVTIAGGGLILTGGATLTGGPSLTGGASITSGSATSFTHSSGSLGGMSVTGGLYASGTGVMQSSSAGDRAELKGAGIDYYTGGTYYASIFASAWGLSVDILHKYLDVVGGIMVGDMPTTSSTANVFWDAANTGRLQRSTSSARYKADIRPLTDYRRILDATPVTWVDPNRSHDGRFAGFTAEDIAALGINSLHTRDAQGRPDAVNYDRIGAYLMPIVRDHDDEIVALRREISELRELIKA